MPNDPTDDDAYNAMVQSFIQPSNRPYDDTPPMLGPHDYTDYINGMSNMPNADQSFNSVAQIRPQQLLRADQQTHDSIQTDPDVDTKAPLEELIPKVYSKTANKDELMRFYKLTGTSL